MAARILGPHALPGPPRRSLAGHRAYIRAFDRDPLAYLESLFAAYGPVSALVAGEPRLAFALGSAANQELVASSQLRCPHPSELGHPGRTSVTIQQLSAAEHREQSLEPLALRWYRYLAEQPVARAYAASVVDYTQQMTTRWGLGQQLDLVYVVRRLNLRILLTTLLGIDTGDDEGRQVLHEWITSISGRPRLLFQLAGPARRREQHLLEWASQAAASGAEDAFLGVLRPERGRGANPEPANLLLQQTVQLLNVVEEQLTSALVWALLLLSQHERVASDVRAELRSTAAGSPTAAGRLPAGPAQLPLLERVVKESLRLLPPRCLGLRQMTTSAEILGYTLPQNATVVFSPFLTHRLSSLFVAPRRFRPERWLYIEPSSGDYLPLGATGVLPFAFLLLHLKLVLATLLERSRLVLAAGAKIDYQLHPVLLPRAELPMIVAPLERRLIRRDVHGSLATLVDFGLG